MATINKKIVLEKYDEVSHLETLGERREFLLKQSEEMKVALWQENIDQKTKGINLSAEQKEILNVIKKKIITVEFAESVKGKSEEDAGSEYNETMSKASRLLGREMLRELFIILGDSNTFKESC